MAPKSDLIRYSPTPAFTARVLALPVLTEAVHRALDVYEDTKTRNDAMGAALRAAEASMRVAASGAMPLATPIVNTVGGWGVVDEWACRGLDKVEKVAPIIKKQPREIIHSTRQTVLRAVAGDNGTVPDSFSEAFTARANQAVNIAEFMANSRGGHVSHGRTRVPHGGVLIKVTSLLNKTQQRLYRSVYVLIRPPNDRSLDGPISVSMLVDFGRRTAEELYVELLREPLKDEPQNPGMAVARTTVKLTKQYTDQINELLKKQVDSVKTMDRDAIMQMLQNSIKTSLEISSNTGSYVQGGLNAVVNAIGNVVQNAGSYRTYVEDMLRKAMADYENKERAARAAAAAESWRKKNNMERVVSPPPPQDTYRRLSSSKSPVWEGRRGSRS
ncbi:lipid storage droplets surface-binding protein 2-like [Macrobrachium nipponense]|uniref:lipid storage droplets surface-binding protein 2-like n=1 Tax=Macrobrachium nipponense TaxID=159736 RepID=UPI0030C89FBC